ncbi:MAG: hypothetical protein IPG74_19155 [Flavobacteriales bacterium]|nr:hypothetical protein [Flavobacteriales bacterium]
MHRRSLDPLRERGWLLLALLLVANALSLFLFRWFTTLDGPTLALKAAVIESSWTTPKYLADGVAYDVARLPAGPSELIMMAFLKIGGPAFAQTAFGVLAVLMLGLSVIALLRALDVRPHVAVILLLPLSFNYLLVLGVFAFLLSTAMAFATVAWWISIKRLKVLHVFMLLVSLFLCSLVHRSGGPVALVLLACCELMVWRSQPDAYRTRWSFAPMKVRLFIIGVVTCAIALLIHRMQLLSSIQGASLSNRSPFLDLVGFRPFLLFDRSEEVPYLLALGLLFVSLVVVALRRRLKNPRSLMPVDGLAACALVLIMASLLVRNRLADMLFLAERAQTIAFILLALWAVAQPRSVISSFLSALALAVHVVRLVHAEEKMAGLEARTKSILTAGAACGEGSVIMPITLEPNWLLTHNAAYLAIDHPGIVLTTRDHLNFTTDSIPADPFWWYLNHRYGPWDWFGAHVAQHNPPLIDHVLVIGNDPVLRDSIMEGVQPVLDSAYWITQDDGYSTLYTLKQL